MPASFYDRVPATDGLAGERTFLAAERTLLAYARTAFAMFATGLTGGQLLQDTLLVVVGYTLAVLALVVFLLGVWRYRESRARTRRMLERLQQAAQPGQANPS